ncbi:MAG: hypothetical protein LAP21_01865, partial [Acidobacteriia bacterium]|nr:hypothetical protein [Terriglobia bacterium]
MPAHLVPLIPPEWGLWNWFVLRGAGFPAQLITRLSDSRCATAADQLAASEANLRSLYEEAAHALDQRLDDLKQQGLGTHDAGF